MESWLAGLMFVQERSTYVQRKAASHAPHPARRPRRPVPKKVV